MYRVYGRKIFIFIFKAIFIFKIENFYATEEGLAGEQCALAAVLPNSLKTFYKINQTLLPLAKKFGRT
jgi:hypothetical protein